MSIGKPLPHDAAALHVNGSARYIDDIPTPSGALHLAFGTSPIAAGSLNAMNLDAVRTAPGVISVMVASDLKHDADVSPSAHDEPLLAVDTVAYVGQPMFLVIATSHTAARAAARRAIYDITEGTPIFSIKRCIGSQ